MIVADFRFNLSIIKMIHNEKQAFSTLVAMQNEFCRQLLFIPYYNGFNQQYIFIKTLKCMV